MLPHLGPVNRVGKDLNHCRMVLPVHTVQLGGILMCRQTLYVHRAQQTMETTENDRPVLNAVKRNVSIASIAACASVRPIGMVHHAS